MHLAGRSEASLRVRSQPRRRPRLDDGRRCQTSRSTRSSTARSGPRCPLPRCRSCSLAGRVVLIGLSGGPSLIDTRDLVLKDVTAVGILSASPGLADTVERYADGRVDPRPLVAGTVGLDQVGDALAGQPLPGVGTGPKIHIDPRR